MTMASGLILLMVRSAISAFGRIFFTSLNVPPTRRLRFLCSMMSGSTGLKVPTGARSVARHANLHRPDRSRPLSSRRRSHRFPGRGSFGFRAAGASRTTPKVERSAHDLEPGHRAGLFASRRPAQSRRPVTAEHNRAMRNGWRDVEKVRDEFPVLAKIDTAEAGDAAMIVHVNVEETEVSGSAKFPHQSVEMTRAFPRALSSNP